MIRILRAAVLGGLGLAALVAAGCRSTGSYPIEVFNEMHYQPNRQQEPGRHLPVEGAVPWASLEDFNPSRNLMTQSVDPAAVGALQSPLADKAEAERVGKGLYEMSCAACHGSDGKGKTIVADRFAAQTEKNHKQSVRPIDLSGFAGAPEGMLFGILTNGGPVTLEWEGQRYPVMPSFRDLLTDEQRWHIVAYVKTLR